MVQLYSQTGASPPSDTYPLLDTEIYQIFREYLQPEVLVANKLILPTIAGGGDHQNIPRGFLSAGWIPIFLMSGWVFSLLFDAWLIWYARM